MVVTEGLATDTEGTEGIDMLPALMMGAGALMGGLYSVGQAVDSNRYWRDYYKNTGYKPRYPFRAGKYDWMQSTGASMTDFGLSYNFWRKAYYNRWYY